MVEHACGPTSRARARRSPRAPRRRGGGVRRRAKRRLPWNGSESAVSRPGRALDRDRARTPARSRCGRASSSAHGVAAAVEPGPRRAARRARSARPRRRRRRRGRRPRRGRGRARGSPCATRAPTPTGPRPRGRPTRARLPTTALRDGRGADPAVRRRPRGRRRGRGRGRRSGRRSQGVGHDPIQSAEGGSARGLGEKDADEHDGAADDLHRRERSRRGRRTRCTEAMTGSVMPTTDAWVARRCRSDCSTSANGTTVPSTTM